MNHKHGPKFFCEFCNTEVPLNARLCPKCGRFFASVHCPNCGHTGEHSAFKKGCPNCGYAMKTADENDCAAPVKQKPKKKRRSASRMDIRGYTPAFADYFKSFVRLFALKISVRKKYYILRNNNTRHTGGNTG